MPALSTVSSQLIMLEKGKRYRTRAFRESDALLVWKWFQDAGWRFGYATWTLACDVSSLRQWVTVNEYDRPIAYIAVAQQSWGQFVPAYITAKKYRNQGIGFALWQETVGRMDKENVGLTSGPDMVKKYAARSNTKHVSPVEIIFFQGRVTFLDGLKTLPKGLFNPHFKVYPIQDDRTIEKVVAYDQRTFSKSKKDKAREEFLWKWLRKGRITSWDPAPKILSLYAENPMGAVVGYGSIQPARGAAKIAPLYADTPEIARTLMTELLKLYNSTVVPVDQLLMVVPSNKNGFIDFLHDCGLATSLQMQQAFTKEVPNINYDRIFGIASQFCQLY